MSEQTTTAENVQAQSIALYRRFADDVSSGRLDVIDELLAPDIQLPTIASFAEPNPAGLKQVNQEVRAAFPDFHVTIEQIFAVGEWVSALMRWEGTSTGEFMGQPPTGRTISFTEIEIVRCHDGRIVDLRQVADVASLMSQLQGDR